MEEKEKILNFTQHSELHPINYIIIHVPQMENFLSTLHPAASLFLDVVNYKELIRSFEKLQELLIGHNIKVLTVKEILQYNRKSLEDMAKNHITYKIEKDEDYFKLTDESQQFLDYYASEDYKDTVLAKLDDDQLFNIVMTNPSYVLKYSHINTGVDFKAIKFSPTGNLLHCRDQQIVTPKGVVLGRFNAKARQLETPIMRNVWKNLGVNILGEIPEPGTLEGGDFIIFNQNLAFLGIGLRTNLAAAKFLMENDFIGTQRLLLVIDENDLSQRRMNLDTFFNILDSDDLILLDFEKIRQEKGLDLKRRALLYEKNKNIAYQPETDLGEYQKTYGQYTLTAAYHDFQTFLEEEGYRILKITMEDQENEITNFLYLGNRTVLSSNLNLSKIVKENNINVNIKYIDFEEVRKMYGALHCIAQVSRFNLC